MSLDLPRPPAYPDGFEAPCGGSVSVYDELIDLTPSDSKRAREVSDYCRSLCRTCPVFTRCMLENADEDWAQAILKSAGPKKARKPRPTEPPPHGTDAAYFRHLRKTGDTPCEPCKAAHREAERARIHRKKKTA